MDTEYLKTFCIIAQEKSFRKAAEALHISTPAITRRIQSLEDALGKPLLQRTSKSVQLTEFGKTFYPYAERITQTYAEGLRQTYEVNPEILAIAGSATTCYNLLPPLIRAFKTRHSMTIRLFTAMADQIYELLLDQIIDVGFTTSIHPGSKLSYEQVFLEKVVFVGNPELVRAYANRELKITKWPIPIIAFATSIQQLQWQSIHEQFTHDPRFQILVEAGSFRITERLTRLGVGFALLPVSDALEDIKCGQLQIVQLPEFDIPKRPVYFVTSKNRLKKPSVRQFLKFTRTEFSQLQQNPDQVIHSV